MERVKKRVNDMKKQKGGVQISKPHLDALMSLIYATVHVTTSLSHQVDNDEEDISACVLTRFSQSYKQRFFQ